MIVSVSRRTDIPAFYSDWFFNRLDEGFVYTRNPMNRKQVSKISLTPEAIDCFVFWTRNPAPMFDRLKLLEPFPFYFLFTITPYDAEFEPYLPPKREQIEQFKRLSDTIGPKRVHWRYDPVFLAKNVDVAYHEHHFSTLAESLNGYTHHCIFSFYDEYASGRKVMNEQGYIPFTVDAQQQLSKCIAKIAQANNLSLSTCSEAIDLEKYGINHGSCIDSNLIKGLTKKEIPLLKDKRQRPHCLCVKSIDIGSYSSCPHGCIYCYANRNRKTVTKNYAHHDPHLPLLNDKLHGDEKIRVKS